MNLTLLKIIPETIDVYRRDVYPYANVRSVCTAFYVLSGRGSLACVFRPCLPPRVSFSQRTTGVFMGLLYDRSRPLGRAIHAHAEE